MPITLTAPPTVVEGARSYAEHSGMTLEAFVLKYLESVAMNEQKRREREAREMFDYFMAQKGSLVEGTSSTVKTRTRVDIQPFENAPAVCEKTIERLETTNFCDLTLKTT